MTRALVRSHLVSRRPRTYSYKTSISTWLLERKEKDCLAGCTILILHSALHHNLILFTTTIVDR